MFKPRIIGIMIGGLLLALGLIIVLQLLDVFSRISGEQEKAQKSETIEAVAPLGVRPTVFTDISEVTNGLNKLLRISGSAEPNSVIVILDRGERLRQIRSDEDGNWRVALETDDDQPMVIEAVLFNEGGVTVRGDETIYRVVLPGEAKPVIVDDTVVIEAELVPRPTLIMVSAPGGPTRIVRSPFGGSPTNGPLTMGPIDYDDAGGVIFSGTTSEEGRVRLYANDAAIGETRVGAGGRWNFIAGRMLPRGEYDVRAELIRTNAERIHVTVPFELLPPTNSQVPAGIPMVRFEPFRWQLRRELLGGGTQSTVIFAPIEADPIIPDNGDKE
ncbi:hypothetical protein DES40_0030 [Litorimonas taeanensis]|uniref:Bacterial Ig domain-containing protein n=1 Tax=Litorimonas taeanensis TaxID=568099 RepID=A0A420WI78_9PROT|nr:hypothetical protein [Litorimonas taeanensis]RKQ70731.1 hypothetical protein DES40_0030 [Litorimonas taeanensis]